MQRHATHGLLNASDVATFVRTRLGEDASEGLNTTYYRSRLKPYVEPQLMCIPITQLPSILLRECSIVLTNEQANDISVLGKGNNPSAVSASNALVTINAAAVSRVPIVPDVASMYENLTLDAVNEELVHRDRQMVAVKRRPC